MPVLTYNESLVVDVVRRQTRDGCPVATGDVKDILRGRVQYDAVDRALRGLAKKGLVERPTRGFWLPPDGE